MIDDLQEVKGFEPRLELLIVILNRRRAKLVLEDDPGRTTKS